MSWHVEPPPQLTEQLPVHVMWHVAPPEQSTLALGPTVIEHDDVPVHLRLHDEPHAPVQSFEFEQSSEQLAPHVEVEMSQVWPDGHAHVAPVHFGGVPLLLLHAPEPTTNTKKTSETNLITPS